MLVVPSVHFGLTFNVEHAISGKKKIDHFGPIFDVEHAIFGKMEHFGPVFDVEHAICGKMDHFGPLFDVEHASGTSGTCYTENDLKDNYYSFLYFIEMPDV